jgi:hypothetical protein
MPVVFYKDAKGEHKAEGLGNSEFNLSYDDMYLSTDLISNQPMGISYEMNPKRDEEAPFIYTERNEAKNSGFVIGKFVFSESFAPCIAVLARLKDGNFALYHANTQFMDEGPGKEFINEIMKRGIVDLHVFEKVPAPLLPEENLQQRAHYYQLLRFKIRAAVIALGLEANGIPTKHVRIENYTCIIADASINKICLGKQKISRVLNTKAHLLNRETKDIGVGINVNANLVNSNDSKEFLISAKERNPDYTYGPAVSGLLLKHKATHPDNKHIVQPEELAHFYEIDLYNNELRAKAMNVPSDNKYQVPPKILSPLEKIKLPNNKLMEEIILLILNEVDHLKQKTTFCFFPAKNAANKAREIERALERAGKQFAIKPFNNVAEFLEYKAPDEISIKEAMNIPRTPGAKPKIYQRMTAAIEKQAHIGIPIQVRPKNQ